MLGEDESRTRLPLREPTKPLSAIMDIGGFSFKGDPLKDMEKERGER